MASRVGFDTSNTNATAAVADDGSSLVRRRANATVAVGGKETYHAKAPKPSLRIAGDGHVVQIVDPRSIGADADAEDEELALLLRHADSNVPPSPTLALSSPGGGDAVALSKRGDAVRRFLVRDPELEKVRSLAKTTSERFIPPPFAKETKVKTKATQAAYIRERLTADKDVFDADVLHLCRKYHALHRRQHDALKNEHQEQLEAEVMQQPLRDRIFTIMENPQSCKAGRILATFESLLVLLTLTQFILETVPRLDPDFNPSYANVWFSIELVVALFFTLETMLRFALSREKKRFFLSILNILDIIAITPFYVLLIFESDGSSFGFFKVLRMVRFVKLFRRFRHIDALILTLSNIGRSLIAPMLFLLVSVVLIATFLFYVEGGEFLPVPPEYYNELRLQFYNSSSLTGKTGEDAVMEAIAASRFNRFYIQDCFCTSTPAFVAGNRTCPDLESPFDSVLSAMWFAVVTITTTGYGDIVPVCAGGKLVASVGLLLSTIFLAMPIAIVGESFTETVAALNEREEARKKVTAANIASLRMVLEMQEEAEAQAAAEAAAAGTDGDNRMAALKLASQATVAMTKKLEDLKGRLGMGSAKKSMTPLANDLAAANKAKAKTAGEGLAQYLATVLRVRRLRFDDGQLPFRKGFAFSEELCTEAALQQAANAIAARAASIDATPDGGASHAAAASLGTVPTATVAVSASNSLLRAQIAQHLNAYCATVLETWAATWLEDYQADRSAGGGGGSGAATSRQLKDLSSVDVRTYPVVSKLRLVEAAPHAQESLVTELIFDRLQEYLIVADPNIGTGSGNNAAQSVTRRVAGDGAPVLVNIFAKEILMPQIVARIYVQKGFLRRRTVLLPGTPHHVIWVDGVAVPQHGTELVPGAEINFTPQMRLTDKAFGFSSGVGAGDVNMTLLSEPERQARLKRLSASGIVPVIARVSPHAKSMHMLF